MQKRSFIDKNGIIYSYDPQVPELTAAESSQGTAPVPVRHTLKSNTVPVQCTSLLPDMFASIKAKNIKQLMDQPVLEAYCTEEFWNTLTEEDFIKILVAKKDILLVHVDRKKLWEETLSFQGYCTLLKNGRRDIVKQYCPLNYTESTEWLTLLTLDKQCSEFFIQCPTEILEKFTPEQWQKLLLFDPDFYLSNSRSRIYLKNPANVPVRFWVENICADTPALNPDHFPPDLRVEGNDIQYILKQPRPQLSFISKENLEAFTEEQWIRLYEKNPNVAQYYPGKRVPNFKGGSSICCWICACTAALLFFFTARLSQSSLFASVLPGTLASGILSFFYCKMVVTKLVLDKIQMVSLGLAMGAAFCACAVEVFLLPFSLKITALWPVMILLITGGIFLFYRNRPVIYCRKNFKGYIFCLLFLMLVGVTLVTCIVSSNFTAQQCKETADHFRWIGFTKLEHIFMARHVRYSEVYKKHLADYKEAFRNGRITESMDSFEKLTRIWSKNPFLTQLADNGVDLLAKIRFEEHGSVHQLVRSKTLLYPYVDKNKRKLDSLEKNFRSQSLAMLGSFGKAFDREFPPAESASAGQILSKVQDIIEGFPEILKFPLDLKLGWSLMFKDRKEAFRILKKEKKGPAIFLGTLFESGIEVKKFTSRRRPEIFRSVTVRYPADGEKFFRFLLEYDFEPDSISYLLALSQKEQKKDSFITTLENAILKGYPDKNGYYLAWNTDPAKQKEAVLKRIIHDLTPGKEKAAVLLADKAFKRKDYPASWQYYNQFYTLGGRELHNVHAEQMNKSYYESHKEQLKVAIRRFIGEFDRVYSDRTSVRPPADFDYERCFNYLDQDFIWRYCYAAYHHPRNPAAKDQAERKLRTIKCPEAEYLLAKMHKTGNELPLEAIRIGSSAKFRKIKLEAAKLKVISSRFSVNERMEGIKYLFEQGELSAEHKLAAGRFFLEQNRASDAMKILITLPDSGEKYYELFRCHLAAGNRTAARNDLESALRQKYPVPYEDYKKVIPEGKGESMITLIRNRGKGYKKASLDLARVMAKEKIWGETVRYYRLAGEENLEISDKIEFALALWESGTRNAKEREYSLRYCVELPEDRISANLAWDIYESLLKKEDPASGRWLKTASDKGHHEAEKRRYLQLRTDENTFNLPEKNRLWTVCIERGVREAIIDGINAFIEQKNCPVGKDKLILAGEEYYNNLTPARKIKEKKLKEDLDGIKDL